MAPPAVLEHDGQGAFTSPLPASHSCRLDGELQDRARRHHSKASSQLCAEAEQVLSELVTCVPNLNIRALAIQQGDVSRV